MNNFPGKQECLNERDTHKFVTAIEPKELDKRERGKKIPSGTVVIEEIPHVKQQPGLSWQCNNLAESSNDESSDEEGDDGTACKICKIPWIELREKCRDWVQCYICEEYACLNCYDK